MNKIHNTLRHQKHIYHPLNIARAGRAAGVSTVRRVVFLGGARLPAWCNACIVFRVVSFISRIWVRWTWTGLQGWGGDEHLSATCVLEVEDGIEHTEVFGLLEYMHLFQNAHSEYFYYKNYAGMVGIFLKKRNDIIHLLWQWGSRPAHAEERY